MVLFDRAYSASGRQDRGYQSYLMKGAPRFYPVDSAAPALPKQAIYLSTVPAWHGTAIWWKYGTGAIFSKTKIEGKYNGHFWG